MTIFPTNSKLPSSNDLPSLDFIAGLIAGEGAFMWINQNGRHQPVFQLKMHVGELYLFELIKLKLGLKEKIYSYSHQGRDYVLLLVRRRSSIEKIIIPTFDNRLFGLKEKQYLAWRERYFIEKEHHLYTYH